MDLLLDTHIFLWWDDGAPRLGKPVRQAIADPANRVFVSAVTPWEIAIKRALGKLPYTGSPSRAIAANRFLELPISGAHAERAGDLPAHHADPFDRLLVAQAQLEGFVLVTDDPLLRAYDAAILGLQ